MRGVIAANDFLIGFVGLLNRIKFMPRPPEIIALIGQCEIGIEARVNEQHRIVGCVCGVGGALELGLEDIVTGEGFDGLAGALRPFCERHGPLAAGFHAALWIHAIRLQGLRHAIFQHPEHDTERVWREL